MSESVLLEAITIVGSFSTFCECHLLSIALSPSLGNRLLSASLFSFLLSSHIILINKSEFSIYFKDIFNVIDFLCQNITVSFYYIPKQVRIAENWYTSIHSDAVTFSKICFNIILLLLPVILNFRFLLLEFHLLDFTLFSHL